MDYAPWVPLAKVLKEYSHEFRFLNRRYDHSEPEARGDEITVTEPCAGDWSLFGREKAMWYRDLEDRLLEASCVSGGMQPPLMNCRRTAKYAC